MSDATCIIESLRSDHETLHNLAARLDSTPQCDLARYFQDLQTAFTCHDQAEDLVFYPAIRVHIADGHTIADAYRVESSHVQSMLRDVTRSDHRTRTAFYLLQDFCQVLIAHQKHEENDPIELLDRCLNLEVRNTLGESFQLAKSALTQLIGSHPATTAVHPRSVLSSTVPSVNSTASIELSPDPNVPVESLLAREREMDDATRGAG